MTTEMSDNETVDDVLADMLLPRFDAITAMRANNYDEIKSLVANYRDRIKAAYKRDVEKLNSVIQATVSRSDAEIDRLRRERDTLQREYDECARDYNNAQRARSFAESELRELKKSVGNAAKLREALLSCRKKLANIKPGDFVAGVLIEVIATADVALAAPPRNCDVLSAQEQAKRWEKFCSEHHKKWIGGKIPTGPCECPCYEGNSCNYFLWAQMPYASEATPCSE